MVRIASVSAAASAGVGAMVAPSPVSGSAFSGDRFQARISKPARARLRAIGRPIVPPAPSTAMRLIRDLLAALPGDGALELGLVHVRTALDAELPRLVVELVARAPARARAARALPASAARGDVARRGPRRLAGLSPAGALLLHGARRDLLGAPRGTALAPLALLDVLVLASSLRALLDSARWHFSSFRSPIGQLPGSACTQPLGVCGRYCVDGCFRGTRHP